MTIIKVETKNNLYKRLIIQGHSNFANAGEDIVCSGISSIIFGGLNALDYYGIENSLDNINNENADIMVDLDESNEAQIICQTMLIQLETIQEIYPRYIKIEK